MMQGRTWRSALSLALLLSATIGAAPTSLEQHSNLRPYLSAPTNVRATQSLATCRSYAGGGLAGFGCAAAMQNQWYILIWDWRGSAIDGFRVYRSQAAASTRKLTLQGIANQLLQTISQHASVRVAIFDPKQVGTNACFTVAAYSGVVESNRSAPFCVGAANAASAVFKSVALVPTTHLEFYGYHHERTHLNYCSSGSWPTFPDGTGVFTKTDLAPNTTGWGMLMSQAVWHAGTEPLACPEFFTQVLRSAFIFEPPADLASVQAATLTGTVQAESGSFCSYAIYWLQSAITGTNPSTLSMADPPGGFAYAFPSTNGWRANRWLFASGPALSTAAALTSPLSTDVSSAVKNSNGGAFLFEALNDEIGSPPTNSLHHGNVATCQTTFRDIRLNLRYTTKAAF